MLVLTPEDMPNSGIYKLLFVVKIIFHIIFYVNLFIIKDNFGFTNCSLTLFG